jgi:hypothetical protein
MADLRVETMMRFAVLSGALLALAATSPASAQWSFGVGVGYGDPGYYAPPGYYGPPPGYYYEQPPAVYVPAQPVPAAVPPDVVFDNLERAGYREFTPMAFRDGVYKLNAINRRGDLVSLEVSVLTGEVEREYLIARRQQAAAPPAPLPAPAPAPAHRAPAPPGGNDPLVVY